MRVVSITKIYWYVHGKGKRHAYETRLFYSRKLHSLLRVIPLGFFLVEHMLTNFAAFDGGKEAFQSSVKMLNDLPLIFFLEMFGIWLPLLYHGVYGLYIAYTAKNNVGNFNYGRNVAFLWQRIMGSSRLFSSPGMCSRRASRLHSAM